MTAAIELCLLAPARLPLVALLLLGRRQGLHACSQRGMAGTHTRARARQSLSVTPRSNHIQTCGVTPRRRHKASNKNNNKSSDT